MTNIAHTKVLILVVDMIKGFVSEGVMSDKGIAKIIPTQVRLIDKMIADGHTIGFIKDHHHQSSSEFSHFPDHCIAGTAECELVDELKGYQDHALIYLKNSTSAIFNKQLLLDIDKMDQLQEVIIVGCCTDICVVNLAIPLQNYFDENDRLVKITVIKDAVATFDSDAHHRDEYDQIAFKLMKQAGINLIESSEVL